MWGEKAKGSVTMRERFYAALRDNRLADAEAILAEAKADPEASGCNQRSLDRMELALFNACRAAKNWEIAHKVAQNIAVGLRAWCMRTLGRPPKAKTA